MKHSQKRTFMDIEKMSSDEFKAFCRLGNKNHFTRIRKMPLQDLLFTMINRKGLTLALELRNYMKLAHPGVSISKPGYLKQRMKLNPDAFLELYKYHNRNFYADSTFSTYKNHWLCHNKQLINSHFYRGVSELPYKLLFAVIYTHLEFRYEVSHTITSHHVHHFHQTRIPDGTLLDYMVQYRKPLFPQFFLYPKKFLPENNPHHKEFHLRPYIQNNANQ